MEFKESYIQFSLHNNKAFLHCATPFLNSCPYVFGSLVQCFFDVISSDLLQFNKQMSNKFVLIGKSFDEKVGLALFLRIDYFVSEILTTRPR